MRFRATANRPRRIVRLAVCALLALLAPPGFARADDAAAKTAPQTKPVDPAQLAARIEGAIARLGDRAYETRQNAQTELIEIGPAAFEAVKKGTRHDDAEIRYRCRQILAELKDQQLAARRKAIEERLPKFVADDAPGDKYDDFPLWDRYRAVAGDDAGARKLFEAILRDDLEFVQNVAEDPEEADSAFRKRIRSLMEDRRLGMRQAIPTGQMGAAMLTALDAEPPFDQQTFASFSSLIRQSGFAQALNDDAQGPAAKKLLGAILSKDSDDTPPVVRYYMISLALQLDVPQGIEPALRMVNQVNGQVSQVYYRYAIAAIARFGKPEHADLLEPLLTNETRVSSMRINSSRETATTQLRDLALAAMVKLTGQKLEDYGFSRAKTHVQYVFDFNSLGFTDSEKSRRDDGVARWRRWKAGQRRAEERK